MRNFFEFDGQASSGFDAWIARSNAWDGATHDDSSIEVPGRNGALVYSNDRWHNFELTVSCYMPHRMQTNVDALRAYLSSKHDKYYRYEEALKPDEFRLARYVGPFTLSASDRVGAAFDVVFDCKPQRFLKSGDVTVTYTANGNIYNPTHYTARPLIKCYGTAGAVTVGGVTVAVGGCTAYAMIDCDLMEVYEGTASRNGVTTLTNGEFPTIPAGESAVAFTGFTKVEIVPRWWQI